MGCFVLSWKLCLTWLLPEATGLLYCPIRLSQVLENIIIIIILFYHAILSSNKQNTKFMNTSSAIFSFFF